MSFLKSVVVVMLVLIIGSVLAGSSIQVSNPQAANFTCPFTSQTSVTCTHNLGTTAVLVEVYNAASPPVEIFPSSIAITSNNVVTVTFSASQSGTVVINGSNGSGGGGGGSSFNQTIKVAGVSQPQEPALNFAANVTCTDTPGVSTNCTPSGGGGGGTVPLTGWTLLNASPSFLTFDNYPGTGTGTSVSIGADGQSGVNWGAAYQAIPGATYTVIATINCVIANVTSSSAVCGLNLTDGTKLYGLEIESNSSGLAGFIALETRQVSSVTTGGSVLIGPTHGIVGSQMTLKVQDNGTNRIWSYYSNGSFVTFVSEASNTFLTPTGVGVGVLSVDPSAYLTAQVLQWAATTP